MQTKFNIGDEVRLNGTTTQFTIRDISITGENKILYCDCGTIAKEESLTLIRPKGSPFKVGDLVKISGYPPFIVDKIERNEFGYAIAYDDKGNSYAAGSAYVVTTDECPKTSAQTHVDELRTVLDEICKVLKLPGSPSYLELPKIIGTRLDHLATAYAHCDELREILYLSSSSSIPMIVAAVKELKDLYDQSRKVANDNRRSWRRELNGIVQALKGGATSENVDMILLCNHRMQQIDELKKKLDEEQERSAKIKSLFDFVK